MPKTIQPRGEKHIAGESSDGQHSGASCEDRAGSDVGDPGGGEAVEPHVAGHVQGAHKRKAEADGAQSARPAAEPEVDGHQREGEPDEDHPVQGLCDLEGRLPHHLDPVEAPVGSQQARHVHGGKDETGHQGDGTGGFG
jgi:hypothetical protein